MRSFKQKGMKAFGAAAIASALIMGIGTATSARAAGQPTAPQAARLPMGMTAADFQLMQEQTPLDAAATKIQALAAKPGAAHDGFFDTKVVPSRHTLIVYWHGSVPASMQRLITQLQGKITIQVVKTRYSLATLNAAIAQSVRTGGATGGYTAVDGSGITISLPAGSMRPAAARAFSASLGVPVTVVPAAAGQLQTCAPNSSDNLGAGSRCDDISPDFWGGAVIQSSLFYCSTGFGVHNSGGGLYLMTAAHCSDNGSGYVNGTVFHNGQDSAHWLLVGSITDVPGNHDGALIPTSAGNHYYDGPGVTTTDTTNTKIVAGQLAVSVGDSLCESGAFGGVICGFNVTSTTYSRPDPNFGTPTWTNLALATSSSGRFTIGGDSGGPWFSLDGCCTHVWAKGIHQGLQPINGVEYEVFTPVTVIANDTGTSVNTG
jgi:hypothetical protein